MKSRHHSRRGQTAILFSMTMTVLFGAMGLVVDLGWSYYRKQVAQAAAQAAAIAAVSAAVQASSGVVSCGALTVSCQPQTVCPDPGVNPGVTSTDKGCLYATANGFSNSGRQGVTIEAGTGVPPTAPGVTAKYWATVRVSEGIPQLFSTLLGKQFATVSVRSTAAYFPPIIGGCIYVLSSNAQAMQMNGNIVFQTGCGVNINSDYYAALKMDGGATLRATNSSNINIVGNYSLSNNATVSPIPITGAPHFADPMRDVPPPPTGSCSSTGVSLSNNQKQTISPGVYCGAINVTGHAVLTMDPGMYVLVSGGISVGGQATLNGTGVTMYVQSGSVSLAGGATTNLSAPTSGPWQGVLFYQDRADTSSASLVGGSGQLMTGVLYFPTTHMDYDRGSATTAQNVTIIADTLNVTGNSYITSSGSSPFMTLFSGVGVLE